MSDNIRQLPSGRYNARYAGPDGERHSITRATKKAVKDALAIARADMTRGVWTDESAGAVTFEKFAVDLLKLRSVNLAPRTVANYETLLERWLLPFFGKRKLKAITVMHVDAWSAQMTTATGQVNRRNACFLLSSVMRHALRYQQIKSNPRMVTNAGKDVAEKRPFLSIDDFERIVSATPPHMHAALWLAMGAHLRRGELCGLNRGDLDLDKGTLTVARQAVQVKGEGLVLTPTKTGCIRTIALPEKSLAAISAHVKANPGLPLSPLFLGSEGRRLSANTLSREWRKAAEAAGMPAAHLHDVRHTGLTTAAQHGAMTKELMMRAGHSTSAASLRYQHATAERDNEIATKLSAAFA